MSYKYLLDLHKLVDTRIAEAKQLTCHKEIDSKDAKFHEGRIDILSDVKSFLAENLNPKLPRSLRNNKSLRNDRSQ